MMFIVNDFSFASSNPIAMIAKTRQQIAMEYGICTRTLKRWLAKKGIKLSKGLLKPKEQEMIYEAFGHPAKRE